MTTWGRALALASKVAKPLAQALAKHGIRPLSFSRADALLWIEPRPRPLRELPGPLLDGKPVGVVFESDVDAWLRAASSRSWESPVVLSMGSHRATARAFARRHGAALISSDRVSRVDLSAGAKWIAYFGHGHARGFTAFRGLRWRHVRRGDPCGAVLAFSCGTLPFGRRWIQGGRAAAYVGTLGPTPTEFNRTLALSLRHSRIDRWIRSLPREILLHPACATLRILGNPLQPL